MFGKPSNYDDHISNAIIQEVLEDEFDFVEGFNSIEMESSTVFEDIKSGRNLKKSVSIQNEELFKKNAFIRDERRSSITNIIKPSQMVIKEEEEFSGRNNFIKNISEIKKNSPDCFNYQRNHPQNKTGKFDMKFGSKLRQSNSLNDKSASFYDRSTGITLNNQTIMEENPLKELSLLSFAGRNRRTSLTAQANPTVQIDNFSMNPNFVNRFNNVDNECMSEIKGKIYFLVKSQPGSRFFQRQLDKIPAENLDLIFSEIEEFIPELLQNPYANYFLQNFFNYINDDLRKRFLIKTANFFDVISMDRIGTYTLQSILEKLKNDDEKLIIVRGLNYQNFFKMSTDSKGIHVAEKLMGCFSENLIPHIYSFIQMNFLIFAESPHAIGVLKKAIQNLKNQSTRLKYQKSILENFINLIYHPFGNHAIQTAIESWSKEYFNPVICCFNGNFYEFSLNKFSSNSVEKCLEYGGEVSVMCFMKEISYNYRIVDLMRSNYGNFVVQKALKVSKDYNFINLTNIIKQNIMRIGNIKLILKWQSIILNFEKERNIIVKKDINDEYKTENRFVSFDPFH